MRNSEDPQGGRDWAEPFVLCTSRTRLRPSSGHIHAAPAVSDWICWDGPETLADLVDRYVSWRLHTPAEPVYVFVLERVEDDTVIGEGTLRFDGHPGVGDLGYWLGAAFHGAGHGSDAVELLVRAGFERCGARALTAQVKAGNVRSLAALERSGFRLEALGDEVAALALPVAERPITWAGSLTRRSWERRKRGGSASPGSSHGLQGEPG